MSNRSLYEDTDSGSLINFEDEASDADSLVQQDPVDEDAVIARQVAKALDAAEERTEIPDEEEEGLPPLASRSTNRVWLEDTPLRDAGPAPPDYTEATAWRKALLARFNGQRSAEPDEELYGEIQLPQSNRPHSVPPEYTDENGGSPFTFRRLVSNKATSKRRRWRYLFWIVGLYLLVTSLFAVPWIIRSRHVKTERRIATKDHPSESGTCQYDSYSNYAKYKFDNITDFNFEYESYSELYPDITFTRNLNVYPAPPEQEATVEVWMNVATSKPYEFAKFSALERIQGLYMRDPVLHQPHHRDVSYGRLMSERKQSCADIWIAMFIRPEGLVWLNVEVDHVKVGWGYPDNQDTKSGLNIPIPFFSLRTTTGDMDVNYLASKYTDLYTESGTITGRFAFIEQMCFLGDNGKLNITLEPEKCEQSDVDCETVNVQSELTVPGVKRPTVSRDDLLVASNISLRPDIETWWNDNNAHQDPVESGKLWLHKGEWDEDYY